MKMSEQINELATALAKFQSNVKQPLKDKANPFFKSKYVPLENVAEAITETAGPLGISFMQFAENKDSGEVGVSTIVLHSSGQYIHFDPVFAKPAKNDPQGIGSAITYLKRYSLSASFGITSDEDDDGNSNMKQTQQVKPQYNKPVQQQQKTLVMPKTLLEAESIIMPSLYTAHAGKTVKQVWESDKPYLAKVAGHDKAPAALVEAILIIQQHEADQKIKKATEGQ